jgi:transposase
MSAERIHADDTTVPVLAKLKTVTDRIWTYVRDDQAVWRKRPAGGLVLLLRNRAGEHPQSHLAGYVGLMQADAFNGYNDSTTPTRSRRRSLRRPAGATAAGSSSTWRKRERPRLPPRPCGASMNCSRSSAPSTAKHRNSGLPCGVKNRSRSSSISKPGCASSEPCSHQATTPQRPSTTFNRWAAFTRFLDDGRVCLTNDAAERALRGVAVGRRNWTSEATRAGFRAHITDQLDLLKIRNPVVDRRFGRPFVALSRPLARLARFSARRSGVTSCSLRRPAP